MRTSRRRITPFYVMEVMERAAELERAGRDVIHLEVGEPDFATPQCIVDAALRAIRDGKRHYTHSLGIIELREAIAEHYAATYNVDVDPGRVIVTLGSSPAMLLAFSALLDRGDIVLLTDPHYACYPNFLYHLDVEPRFFACATRDCVPVCGRRSPPIARPKSTCYSGQFAGQPYRDAH